MAKLKGVNLSPAIPGLGSAGNLGADFSQLIPGFADLTSSASSNVGQLLNGLPSADATRTENAYFGVGSGMPGSEFVRNRGYDLYGQKAEQRKRQGLEGLLALIGGVSGPMTSYRGQDISQQESAADRAERGSEFGQTLGFDREQWNTQKELLNRLLGGVGGSGGGFTGDDGGVYGVDPSTFSLNDYSRYTNAWSPSDAFYTSRYNNYGSGFSGLPAVDTSRLPARPQGRSMGGY
jgi:hypothetical protein